MYQSYRKYTVSTLLVDFERVKGCCNQDTRMHLVVVFKREIN